MQSGKKFSREQINAVARVMCQDDILDFTRYFFRKQARRKFVLNHHHEKICAALERVMRGKCKRLIINIAPRYGKTELVVKMLIAHALANNPAAKFIHLSYSDSLALDNSEYIRDMIMSKAYQELFPHVKIKPETNAKDKWYTTAGGGVLAKAAGGSVTGFGAGTVDFEEGEGYYFDGDGDDYDADFDEFIVDAAEATDEKAGFGGAIIIDDPIKPEDADSETIRDRVNSRFDSTIRERVNSRNTPIIVIMQRLHEDDLAGYLQREDEADKWEVLSLPSIQEDGTALWPFRHTLSELLALERANDIVFARQHRQSPKLAAGLLFPSEQLKLFDPVEMYDSLEDPDFCFIAADPANKGGDDFCIMGTKLIGDKIFVDNVVYNTDGADHNEGNLVTLALLSKAAEVHIEAVFGWIESGKRVRDELTSRQYPGRIRLIGQRQNKHTRIVNKSAFIRNNFVFRSDWREMPEYAKFMRNLTSYQRVQEAGKGNKHDDAPDTCEMVGAFYELNFPKLWPVRL